MDDQKYSSQALSRVQEQPPSPKSFHGGENQDEAPPSRHLWVGNVSQEVTELLLVERFTKFGPIESVTVYSQRNYAFINFRNIESAQDAKNGLQGVALGGLGMRIEFAKGAKPSKHLWVGGIGPSVSREQIEGEFKRFGTIEDLKFLRDRNCAFVDYEKMEDAIAAVDSLNRKLIGDEELQVDYVRSQPPKRETSGPKTPTDLYKAPPEEFRLSDRGPPGDSVRGHSDVSQAGAGPGALTSSTARTKGKKEEPSDVLWVGFPLLSKVDEEGLRRAFVPYGEVDRVKTFPGRTYAFVQFKNVEEATRAKEALEGKLFNDPRVRIRFSNSEIGPVESSRADGLPSSPSRGREPPGYSEKIVGRSSSNERYAPIIAPLRPTGLRPEYYPGGLARGALARVAGAVPGNSLGHGGGKGLRLGGPDERMPLDQIGIHGGRGLPEPLRGDTRPGGRSPYDDHWELPEDDIMKREPKRLRMLPVGGPEPVYNLSYGVGRRVSESDTSGPNSDSGRQEYGLLSSNRSAGGGEEYNKGTGASRGRPGSVQFDGLRHMAASQGPPLALTTTGPGSNFSGSGNREGFATNGVLTGLNEGRRWHGTIAKGGTPVCRAHCVPVGKGIDVTLPDVVNCTARTDLDTLAKHVYQAGDFGVVIFVPEADPDVPPYRDFMHYLGEKHRAGVAKLVDGTTLFLVPPSEFSERVLKVPGNNCLFGVVLKSQPIVSTGNPQPEQQQLPSRPTPPQHHHSQQQQHPSQQQQHPPQQQQHPSQQPQHPSQLLQHPPQQQQHPPQQQQHPPQQQQHPPQQQQHPSQQQHPPQQQQHPTQQQQHPSQQQQHPSHQQQHPSHQQQHPSQHHPLQQPQHLPAHQQRYSHSQNPAFVNGNSGPDSGTIPGPSPPQGQPPPLTSINSTLNSSQLASLASGLPTVLTPELLASLSAFLPQQSQSSGPSAAALSMPGSNAGPPMQREMMAKGAPSLVSSMPSSSVIDNRIAYRPPQGNQHPSPQSQGWPSFVSDQQPSSGLMSSPPEQGSAYLHPPPLPHAQHIPNTSVLQLPHPGSVPSQVLPSYPGSQTQDVSGYGGQQLPLHTRSPQDPASQLGAPLLPSDQLAQLTALLTQGPQQTAQQQQAAHQLSQHYHQQQPPVHSFSQQHLQQPPLPYHQPQAQSYHQQIHPPQQYAPQSPSQQQVAHMQHPQSHMQPPTTSFTPQQSQNPVSQQPLPSSSVNGEHTGSVGQDDSERRKRFDATLQLAAALLHQMQHQQAPGQGSTDHR